MKFEPSCFTVILLFGSSCLAELVQTGLPQVPAEKDRLIDFFDFGLKCRNGGRSFMNVCVCPKYYTGPRCEIKTCVNNGQLETVLRSTHQICKCPNPQYITGEHCEILRCSNYGVFNGVSCDCKSPTYQGEFCEKLVVSPTTGLFILLLVFIVILASAWGWYVRCRGQSRRPDAQQQLVRPGVARDTSSNRAPSQAPRSAHRSSSSDDLISTERPTVFRPLTPDYGLTQHVARVGPAPFSGDGLPMGPPPSYYHAVSEVQANLPCYTETATPKNES